MRLITLALVAAFFVSGQTQPCQASARAIFLGEQGAIAPSPGCEASVVAEAKKSSPKAPSPKEAATNRPPTGPQKTASGQSPTGSTPQIIPVSATGAGTMSAMMYWIELVKASGEKQRVTSDHVFRSGEKIRLHVESNVTGRMSVAQIEPRGGSQVLFPDPRINAGDNLVTARVETAIPPAGYFRFDNEIGTERLIVILTPGQGRSADTQVVAGAILDEAKTVEMARSVVTSSRGLLLEAVEEPGQAAKYVAATGPIRLEIKLKHQ